MGRLHQPHCDRRAADRQVAQAMRRGGARLDRRDDLPQHLRDHDRGARVPVAQRGQQAPGIQPGTAGEPHRGQPRQADRRARQQRRIEPADVFQQGAQRKQAKMAVVAAGRAGDAQRLGDGLHRVPSQADAFRFARRPRRERDLVRAGGQDRSGSGGLHPYLHQCAVEGFDGQAGRVQGRQQPLGLVGQHPIDRGGPEYVGQLGRREKQRQGNARDVRCVRGQVGQRPGLAVVGEDRDRVRGRGAQQVGQPGDFSRQFAIGERTVFVLQGHLAGMACRMAVQGGENQAHAGSPARQQRGGAGSRMAR